MGKNNILYFPMIGVHQCTIYGIFVVVVTDVAFGYIKFLTVFFFLPFFSSNGQFILNSM